MKKEPVAGRDFRLTFADADFIWAEERRPGMPILRWPDGTLCEPLVTWFGWSAEIDRVAISSMRPEAYALRDWFAFMMNQDRQWDDPEDLLLAMWRESHGEAIKADEISRRQIERKIEIVFDFYLQVHQAIPLGDDGQVRKPIAGRSSTEFTPPISSKITSDHQGSVRETWSGSRRSGTSSVRRPTPDPMQVGKVLAWLRSSGNRELSPHGRRQLVAVLRGERDWLIGRCMVDGGLRAEEVAALSLQAIVDALRSEGCLSHDVQGSICDPATSLLDLLVSNEASRDKLLESLEHLRSRHRRCIYVKVIGKGSKSRKAPFSIDLVRDILIVGVEHVRQSQIIDWSASSPQFSPPSNLFLSFKTRKPLDPGSISDRMKQAFNGAGVDGSGHRLRAHYATAMAAMMWDECFAMNGYRFDQTIVNVVMERLAEAMGHSRVTTTIRHYVDMALLRHFGPASKDRVSSLQALWDVVVRHQAGLSDGKVRMLSHLVETLGRLPDGSELQEVVELALADSTLTGAPFVEPTAMHPRAFLRVVPMPDVESEDHGAGHD